jgi:hypothetical protein
VVNDKRVLYTKSVLMPCDASGMMGRAGYMITGVSGVYITHCIWASDMLRLLVIDTFMLRNAVSQQLNRIMTGLMRDFLESCYPEGFSSASSFSFIRQLIKSSGRISPWPASSILNTSITDDLSCRRIRQTPSPEMVAFKTMMK